MPVVVQEEEGGVVSFMEVIDFLAGRAVDGGDGG